MDGLGDSGSGHDYEVVIIQYEWEVDQDFVLQLMLTGRSFTLVRPFAEELVEGQPAPGYTAMARNQASAAASARWVVFVSEGTVPDLGWLATLESDLALADEQDAPISVGDEPEGSIGRHGDIAYRRDVLDKLGGFDERAECDGQEDLLIELRGATEGVVGLRGRRRLSRRARHG